MKPSSVKKLILIAELWANPIWNRDDIEDFDNIFKSARACYPDNRITYWIESRMTPEKYKLFEEFPDLTRLQMTSLNVITKKILNVIKTKI